MDFLFLLKKTIGFLLQPYGLILLLFIFFIVFYFLGKKLLAKLSFIFALLLFILLANPFIANFLSSSLEFSYPKYNNQQAKYIITLGNSHNENYLVPTSSTISEAGTKRLLEAVIIYHNMKQKPKIILVGYNGFGKKVSYAKMAYNFITTLGVKERDIILSEVEKDSDDEAKTAKKIAKNDKVILITSAMHMPRSMNLFNKYKINAIPAPTDFKTDDRGFFSRPSFLSLQQSNLAVHEYLGLAFEKLKTIFND